MKSEYCLLLLLSLGLVSACSKKDKDDSASAPAAEAPAATETTPAAASASAEAAPAPEAKRNWDAVVAEVARIRAMRPLPEATTSRITGFSGDNGRTGHRNHLCPG